VSGRLVARSVVAALLAVAAMAQDRLAVEVDADLRQPFVSQAVTLTLRVVYDREFFAAHAVSLLQRVDVPFCVDWPGLEGADARLVEPAGRGPTLVVGDREVRAVWGPLRQQDGRAFEVVELTAHWSPTEPGEFVFEPARVRYAFAMQFEESLLGGRQPIDREVVEVIGSRLRLEVRELPAAGLPAGFSGAVGEFSARGEAPASCELGDNFALELVVRGRGNLQGFAAPPWPKLPGYAVQGLVERGDENERRFVFDVLALRRGATLPIVPFSFFSPADGRYVVSAIEVPPALVTARRAGRPLSPRVQRLIARADPAAAPAVWPWWSWLLGGLALLVIAGLAARSRRRSGPEV